MAVLVQEKFIMTPDGAINMSFTEDHTAEAKATAQQRETTGGWSEDRSIRVRLRIPHRLYHDATQKYGAECWRDNDFLKYISRKFPELTV